MALPRPTRWLWSVLLLSALAGCAPGVATEGIGSAVPPRIGSSPPAIGAPGYVGVPLLLDRADLGLGTTVQFDRIPDAGEFNDLLYTSGLAHVVLSLPAWPATFEAIQSLNLRPVDLDVVVVIAGYPPSREAMQAWNNVRPPLRLVLLVDGPPADRSVITDLNALRPLERIIVQTDNISRAGFERLQRPLSFRRIVP